MPARHGVGSDLPSASPCRALDGAIAACGRVSRSGPGRFAYARSPAWGTADGSSSGSTAKRKELNDVLTLVLGLVAALVLVSVGMVWLGGIWASVLGVLGFFAVTIPVNLLTKKRLEAVFTGVQEMIEESQGVLRRKLNRMQNKLTGSGKGLQKELEKQQAASIREALKALDAVKPLRKWSLLAQRQTNTLRAQLHYQIKEFEKADEYFKSCLVFDPMTLAMKMARQYKRDETEALEKAFRKGVRRFKDEKGVLLYALYSWVLVKQDRVDEAMVLLDKAKEDTEDEVLRTNWEHLANGRVRRFSNAGLGDQWYALHLETPKPVRIKQRMGRRR